MYEYCVLPPPNVIITYEESIRFEIDIYFVLSSIYLFIYLFPSLLLINFQTFASTRTITRRNKEIFPFSVLSFELTKKEKESKFLFPCIHRTYRGIKLEGKNFTNIYI